MANEASDFFSTDKNLVTLVDIKPKLNREDEKRLRLDFSMPLTAEVLEGAPQPVKDAFYAIVKDGHTLNPVGIVREYAGANLKFYATHMTAAAELEIKECMLRQLEVTRPAKKVELDDGDVKLKFHVNTPASRKLWLYAYENYGADVFVKFEDAQPLLPGIKAADPEGKNDGQGILNMGKSEPEPTVTDGKKKKASKKK